MLPTSTFPLVGCYHGKLSFVTEKSQRDADDLFGATSSRSATAECLQTAAMNGPLQVHGKLLFRLMTLEAYISPVRMGTVHTGYSGLRGNWLTAKYVDIDVFYTTFSSERTKPAGWKVCRV